MSKPKSREREKFLRQARAKVREMERKRKRKLERGTIIPCFWENGDLLRWQGHGGPREGAGRRKKPKWLRKVPRNKRPELNRESTALHITAKLGPGTGRLRWRKSMRVILPALEERKELDGFRLIHYSIQDDHYHFVAEGDDMKKVSNAMNRIQTALAIRLNKCWGRSGRVWRDRFHIEVLEGWHRVRNVLRYVFQNGVKHKVIQAGEMDPCSSARAFHGWSHRPKVERVLGVTEPRGYDLRENWMIAGGPLHIQDVSFMMQAARDGAGDDLPFA